tara:strand:- start:1159 stop:1824 length:666 start_codon:yes stop_codon:yes gene_type:complete
MTKKYISTWDAMKATASPGEMRELNRIELESLKNKQMFHSSTPVELRKEIMNNNRKLRKEAKKILKDENLTHRFMTSKTVEEFENKAQIPETRDTLKDDFVNPGVLQGEKNEPTDVIGLDTIVYRGPPDKDITPESEFMRVPEFIEQGGLRPLLPEDKLKDADLHNEYIETLKKQKEEEDKKSSRGLPNILAISDEDFGVGSVEKPTEATLNAVRDLKSRD